MAAPAVTSRTTPTGFKMPEGYQATIAFSRNASVAFWEQTVKPSGFDGGDMLETTTQHNVEWHTGAAPRLKKSEDITGTAMYDPDAINAIKGLVNAEGSVTVHNPDGSADSMYAYLSKVEFAEFKIKEVPTLTYTIKVTHWDPVNKVEAGPVHTPSGGT